MNPIAQALNASIEKANPHIMSMMSETGRQLFFPKGILSQSAEAKQKAHQINATIGIAKESGHIMCLNSVMASIPGLEPSESVTYAPSFGLMELRQAWHQELYGKNPSLAGKNISLPVVTCGITHGVSMLADVWIDPGDVVILPDPMWGNYNMILGVRKGAVIRQHPLFTQGRFDLDAFEQTLRREAQQRSKIVVLLNFPHNPSGYSPLEDEAAQLVDILAEVAAGGTNVVVACDDSYFGLFYEEGTCRESLFARLCGLHPRLLAVKLDGATKEAFVWGLRVGFVTYGAALEGDVKAFYEALEKKTAGCIRGSISNASHLSQTITLKAMQSETWQAEKQGKFEILRRRVQRIKEVLQDPKFDQAWEVLPFNSGYFMCLQLKDVNAEMLRQHLLDKYGVGLISIGAHNLRIAFSCLDEHEVSRLFDIIWQGVQDLRERPGR